MPIYTTYLANKPKAKAQQLGSCFVYFVMRNRGNNEVAPTEALLKLWKKDRIPQKISGLYRYVTDNMPWQIMYVQTYKKLLERPKAIEWMEKRAQEAKIGNILLVCYEKDASHCHRRLLAEEIAKRFGVEYKGEIGREIGREKKWYEYEAVGLSFLYLAGGFLPYEVWVWWDERVTLDFGCIFK